MNRPYLLAESTWAQVRDTTYDVAILPWGATEAHNFHLPYATDNLQCDYIAAESARIAWEDGVKAVALPTVPFGVNTGQLDVALDVNMNPTTQMFVLRDVIDTVHRARIERFLVLNGHGGNDFRQMLRELQVEFPDVFLCTLNWWQITDTSRYFEEPGDHAGEMETSIMMQVYPDLVRPLSEAGSGAARVFRSAGLREGWVWAQREWTRVTEDTGVGDPSAASAEKGGKFLDDLTRQIGGFLIELGRCPVDELYVDPTE